MSAIDLTTTPCLGSTGRVTQKSSTLICVAGLSKHPERAQKWTKKVGDLIIDLSKNLINETLESAS